MARSPFQGTFSPNIRPTVVTAPDAVVYINGEMETIGCPMCSRTFNLNKYITSIQVDLSVDSVPGSASISLSIPRHSIDGFYFDGNPVITTMMEIEIYAKGYYLVEGIPQYYPIFWGIITEVSDSYSGGEHTVSISANDILKWWDICKMNINPAYTAPSGMMGRDYLHGNVFTGMNPYDVIFTLALQSFGDIIVGTGSMVHFNADAKQKETFSAAFTDMMQYWNKRFSRMRSNLVLYGTKGVAVRGDTLYQKYSRKKDSNTPVHNLVSTAIQEANGGPDGGQMTFDATSANVTAFRFPITNAGTIDLWQSEYQTKMELANAAKEAIGFELYMDVTGDIVFKPPFYNLDIIGNKPVSWIQDIDVINWDFSESESEVVTQLILQGQYGGTIDFGMSAELTPFTSVTDYHLLRKYGWRSQNLNSEFMSNLPAIFYWGLDRLDRINSRRHRGSVTIPMRPELRLGFPIYVAPKDQIWYVSGISHNIQFGGQATTSLTLTAKRSKFIAPQGMGTLTLKPYKEEAGKSFDTTINELASNGVVNKDNAPRTFKYTSVQLSKSGSFELRVENAATLPPTKDSLQAKPGDFNPFEPLILRHPKTGRIVGYPNVVMAYTRPFAPADISPQAGQKEPGQSKMTSLEKANTVITQQTNAAENDAKFKTTAENAEADKYLTNRYQYGLNSAGAYIYAHDNSFGGEGVISEILTIDSSRIEIIPKDDATLSALRAKTALIRPVSDERGFEVVGHYQYGRRVSLRDGRLVVDGDKATKASVDIQLALSGSLQATLMAESQGLSEITTGYADPASTLATLTADDKQTAGIQNPQTKTPEFVNVGDNFIDSVPLGSDAQKGDPPTVEASQLSRALTLMEMSVKDNAPITDGDCVCLMGRQDLAFINSGYQVKTLTGTSTNDVSVLSNLDVSSGPINSGATLEATARVDSLEAQLTQAEQRLATLTQEWTQDSQNILERDVAKSQAVLEQQKVVASLGEQLSEAQSNLNDLRKQYGNTIFSQSTSEVIYKVEQFLTNLYRALDKPHQEFEKAIRGDLLPKPPVNVALLPGAKVNPPSEFAPPFSEPNRFMLGDPKATLGAVETNVENLEKSWSDFGKDLRKNAEKTQLTREVSRDKASISRLRATRERLVSQQDSHAHVVGVNLQKAIDKIDKQIAKLEQNVRDNQTKLGTNV